MLVCGGLGGWGVPLRELRGHDYREVLEQRLDVRVELVQVQVRRDLALLHGQHDLIHGHRTQQNRTLVDKRRTLVGVTYMMYSLIHIWSIYNITPKRELDLGS